MSDADELDDLPLPPLPPVGFVFEPKSDIKKEYLAKFQHTQSTGVKTQPKFEG